MLLQRLWRWQGCLGYGCKPDATVEVGVAISHCDVHGVLPERIETVCDEPLPDAFALPVDRHRNRCHQERRTGVSGKGKAREEDAADQCATFPSCEDAKVLGGCVRKQAACEGADQRTFLRAFGGGEGGGEKRPAMAPAWVV